MGKGGMVIAAMTASILCLCPRSLRKQGGDFGYCGITYHSSSEYHFWNMDPAPHWESKNSY